MRDGRLALVLLVLCAVAGAQPQTLDLRPRGAPPTARVVTVEVAPTLTGHGRPGPIGWATVTVENLDAEAHRVEVVLADWSEASVVRDTLRLAPHERIVRHYPLQWWQNAIFPRARLDAEDTEQGRPLASGSDAVGVLLVTTRPASTAFVTAMLDPGLAALAPTEARPRGRTRTTPSARAFGVAEQLPGGLPDRWQCLAGFDLVVVDAGLSLGAERERVLLDYCAAGGAVLALDAGTLADGPLRDAIAATPGGRFGFGRLFGGRGARGGDGDRAFAAWVEDSVHGLLAVGQRALAGPAADGMHLDLQIPGLGSVPVLAFFILILLFVVAAGPVNLFLCKRAGRPVLMVFTLPALGFGFAGAILLWGLFSEGLGVKGVVRSVTWLDQRTHQAASQATQTLYSGTTLARLTPAPGSLLMCAEVGQARYRSQELHRYRVDGAGVVDGDVLPSRTPTTLVGVTAQRARERLRFKRTAHGGLEVLAGPEFLPASTGGSTMIVRDHAGQWFVSQTGTTALRPVSDVAAGEAVRAVREAFLAVTRTDAGEQRLRNMAVTRLTSGAPLSLETWLLHHVETLAPGSYVAWLDTNAIVDGFGLASVEWRQKQHLVLGLLAGEDIVD